MILTVDPGDDRPVFQRIADQLRAQIADGRIPAGSRLPPARELAADLEVNLHTVLHAYQALREDGLLELRRGSGAIVTGAADGIEVLRAAVAAAVAEARAAGISLPTVSAMVRAEFSR